MRTFFNFGLLSDSFALGSHSSGYDTFSAKSFDVFLIFLHKNMCYRYSLEVPHSGASNGYPHHMFSQRSKKNIYWTHSLM